MAKIFKFDAIGRDLFPGERQAARVFVSKYESPPSRADAQKQMRTVMGRVLKAAAQVNASANVGVTATVYASQQSKAIRASKAGVGVKGGGTSQLAAKGSPKRVVKG